MCNYSPGDKCRDGRDGNAGPGWLSKSDKYLHYHRKIKCVEVENLAYNCKNKPSGFWSFRLMFNSLMLLTQPQIIQTKGSYSFLLCGMIIACAGFILFIGLLLFHQMHRNYLTGMVSTSTLIHYYWRFIFINFTIIIIPHSNSLCIPTGTAKTSAMVQEPATKESKTEQKEEKESSWERQQLCFVLYWPL